MIRKYYFFSIYFLRCLSCFFMCPCFKSIQKNVFQYYSVRFESTTFSVSVFWVVSLAYWAMNINDKSQHIYSSRYEYNLIEYRPQNTWLLYNIRHLSRVGYIMKTYFNIEKVLMQGHVPQSYFVIAVPGSMAVRMLQNNWFYTVKPMLRICGPVWYFCRNINKYSVQWSFKTWEESPQIYSLTNKNLIKLFLGWMTSEITYGRHYLPIFFFTF